MSAKYDSISQKWNEERNVIQFNQGTLIEQALDEDKLKLAKRVLYFSNKDHCQTICCLTPRIIPEKASDHEEADTKLTALVE